MAKTLKECPFCGRIPAIRRTPMWDLFSDLAIWIQCECGVRGPSYIYDGVATPESTVEYAANEWNEII